MPDVAIDANVLVGLLDRHDSLHANAVSLLNRLDSAQREVVLLDVCVSEAISVLCRRAVQRKSNPPDLSAVLLTLRAWLEEGIEISFVQAELEEDFPEVLSVVEEYRGTVNFNDAFLVVLQRSGRIGDLASFDRPLDVVEGLRRIE